MNKDAEIAKVAAQAAAQPTKEELAGNAKKLALQL